MPHVTVRRCKEIFPRRRADPVLLELVHRWCVEPPANVTDRVAENHHLPVCMAKEARRIVSHHASGEP